MSCFGVRSWLTAALTAWLLAMPWAIHGATLRLALVAAHQPDLPANAQGSLHFFAAITEARLLETGALTVVERSQLGELLKEMELSATLGSDDFRKGEWAGADLILRYRWAEGQDVAATPGSPPSKPAAPCIEWKLFSTRATGLSESQGTLRVVAEDAASLESASSELSAVLHRRATQAQARSARVLLSVMDVAHRSPLAWADWLSGAVTRRLRREAREVAGVLLLEREQLTEVFTEHRLAKGGLMQPAGQDEPRVQRYLLLSAILEHEQPPNAPLITHLHLELTDLSNQQVTAKRTLSASGTSFDPLLAEIGGAMQQMLAGAGEATLTTPQQRQAEARRLVLRTLELTGGLSPREAGERYDYMQKKQAGFNHQDSWWFKQDRFTRSATRRGMVRQAIAYAQAAVMLDDSPLHQSLLAALLLDDDAEPASHVRDSIDLRREMVIRYAGTPWSLGAIQSLLGQAQEPWFLPLLARHIDQGGDPVEHMILLLTAVQRWRPDQAAFDAWLVELERRHLQNELGSAVYGAQAVNLLRPWCQATDGQPLPEDAIAGYFSPEHQAKLAPVRAQATELILKAFQWPADPTRNQLFRNQSLYGDVLRWWFAATQAVEYRQGLLTLRRWYDPTTRRQGHDLVRELMRRQPSRAPWIAATWAFRLDRSATWEYGGRGFRRPQDEFGREALDWFVEAARQVQGPVKPHAPVDHLIGHMLHASLQPLMEEQRWDDAHFVLELSPNQSSRSVPERVAIALGRSDWNQALALLQGRDGADFVFKGQVRVGREWSDYCRQQLGQAQQLVASTVTTRGVEHGYKLPPGEVSAIAPVGDEVWLGCAPFDVDGFLEYFDANGNLLRPESADKMIQWGRSPEYVQGKLKAGGLVRVSPGTHRAAVVPVGEDALPHHWITSLAVSDEHVFVGTMVAGLAIYDRAGATWRRLGINDGLPSLHIRSLLYDASRKRLWIGFGHGERGGLAHLEPGSGHIHVYIADAAPREPVLRLSLAHDLLLTRGRGTHWLFQPEAQTWRRLSIVREALLADAGLIGFDGGPGKMLFLPREPHDVNKPEAWPDAKAFSRLSSWRVLQSSLSGDVLLPMAGRVLVAGPYRLTLVELTEGGQAISLLPKTGTQQGAKVASIYWDGNWLWLGTSVGLRVVEVAGLP